MIKCDKDYESVKKSVESLYRKNVFVTQSLGRNKFRSYDGVVTGVYQALFTVSPVSSYNGKTSFSYSEIMCGNVRLSLKK